MATWIRFVLGGCLVGGLIVLSAASASAAYDWPAKEAPPPQLIEPEGEVVMYANGVQTRHARLTTTGAMSPLPPPGPPQVISSFFDIFTEVSLDGGGSWMPVIAPATATMRYTGAVTPPAGLDSFFDTEMLELNIQGGDLPPGVMIRESPTLASLGTTSVTSLGGGGGGGGGYHIDSFFDIFTELSFDGGQTWSPGSRMHVEGVPEPGTVTLLLAGALCAAGYVWRRKK